MRSLTDEEITVLESQQCLAQSWDSVRVSDPFAPSRIRSCRFFGRIEIGAMDREVIFCRNGRYHAGLYDSVLEECRLGANVSLSTVRLLSGYTVEEEAILRNIDEVSRTRGTAEKQKDEIWIHIGNENGGRAVMLFPTMTAGDAYLWSGERDNKQLQSCYYRMARSVRRALNAAGPFIGRRAVITNCSLLKDVIVHEAAVIEGVTRLDHIVVLSSPEQPSTIADDCVLRNGVIGYGNTIRSGVIAEQFLTNANVVLSNGLQVEHSIIGDNARLSGAEVLSVLTFPFHEQHHKSSFLCAAVLKGESNIAAGTVIGSNHNARKGDGEMRAGRGFWPGLSSTYKYNSAFASFTLAVTGSYTSELNISLPFSLISRDDSRGILQIMPAYWFRCNMYALERNRLKFASRDMRGAGPTKDLRLMTHYLAPDTVEEMLRGLDILEEYRSPNRGPEWNILYEKGSEPARIIKPDEGCKSYEEMIHLWAVEAVLEYLSAPSLAALREQFQEEVHQAAAAGTTVPAAYVEKKHGAAKKHNGAVSGWTNVGGQLLRNDRLGRLKEKVLSGEIDSWDRMHLAYQREAEQYPRYAFIYAAEVLSLLHSIFLPGITEQDLESMLRQAMTIKKNVLRRTAASRKKDYEDPFRSMLYCRREEMETVIGPLDDDPVITAVERETADFTNRIITILDDGSGYA